MSDSEITERYTSTFTYCFYDLWNKWIYEGLMPRYYCYARCFESLSILNVNVVCKSDDVEAKIFTIADMHSYAAYPKTRITADSNESPGSNKLLLCYISYAVLSQYALIERVSYLLLSSGPETCNPKGVR